MFLGSAGSLKLHVYFPSASQAARGYANTSTPNIFLARGVSVELGSVLCCFVNWPPLNELEDPSQVKHASNCRIIGMMKFTEGNGKEEELRIPRGPAVVGREGRAKERELGDNGSCNPCPPEGGWIGR